MDDGAKLFGLADLNSLFCLFSHSVAACSNRAVFKGLDLAFSY